jgi:hypothetical protein
MPDKKRLLHCGCIGLAVASFAIVGAIVAQPILSALWSPQVSIAQFATIPQGK